MTTPALKLMLKEKYGLVHVPYDRKVRRWAELTKSHMKTGQSPENAGMLAARLTFPYEIREINSVNGPHVNELLELYGKTSGVRGPETG